MATQKCPRCGSSRVRHGYRPTPIWLKILFRYNLLCDSCNWEFRGFGVPGTVTTKLPRKRKKANSAASPEGSSLKSKNGEAFDEAKVGAETLEDAPEDGRKKNKPNTDSPNQRVEKRVRIKL